MKTRVIVTRLPSPHQRESFTRFLPLGPALVEDVEAAVGRIFDDLGGAALLRASGEVYLKPNAVDAKPYSFTRPEVLRAVVEYWQRAGARRVFVVENSTQANYTRLVFRGTGYARVCRETGAVPVYLDEEPHEPLPCAGAGYDRPTLRMPATVLKLIRERDRHLYVNLPKLKTHSMGVVTLGVKNQWGFPAQPDRGPDHNHRLPDKLVEVLALIRPDVTLIEGVEGTIHGHYFATALADEQVKPFRVLVASPNVVAADLVGAAIFGLGVADVPHLRLAIERGLGAGVGSAADVELAGDLASLERVDLLGDLPAAGHYPWDLYPRFPDDVRVLRGAELACREGCVNNPLCVLQTLALDHRGRGGWTLVMGKGHDPAAIDAVDGRVLVAGHCAIEEVGARLVARLGRRRVYLSGECNDLCATVSAMLHLMKVSPTRLLPLNPVVALAGYLRARSRSTSRVPSLVANLVKQV